MRGTIRDDPSGRSRRAIGSTLLALVIAIASGGCVATVNVEMDEREDFSTYRTWTWMPQTTPRVKAPPHLAPALEVRLGRLIESTLEERGLRRTDPPADFYVAYHLTVERSVELVEQPMAPYLMSSYSSSASYWIEGSETVERQIDDVRLSIATAPGGGETTWQAVFRKRLEAPAVIPLESAVTELLAHFPATVPDAESDAKN